MKNLKKGQTPPKPEPTPDQIKLLTLLLLVSDGPALLEEHYGKAANLLGWDAKQFESTMDSLSALGLADETPPQEEAYYLSPTGLAVAEQLKREGAGG